MYTATHIWVAFFHFLMTETTTDYTWYKHELGTYRLEQARFGTWTSILEDGTRMVTGATADAVRTVTEHIHMPFHYGSDSSDIITTEHSDISTDELK